MDRIYEEENKTKPEGTVAIRETLNKMGFSNSSIGYDNKNGMVTLDGKALIKPTYLDDKKGVSYASASDIQKSVVDLYKNTSNPVVRVSDAYGTAAGKYGLSGSGLSYGNGTVSIGGNPLNTMYIDDSGKAWARESDVYNLVDQYARASNVKSADTIANNINSQYLNDIREQLEDIKERKSFSYNPDNDPVYTAYKNKYLTEGNRSSQDAIANYSALTGGYANSAAVTAGAMANQYYAGQLSNMVPELAKQAYERYYDSIQTDMNVLDKMINLYDKTYQNAMDTNKLNLENSRYSADAIVDRDNREYEKDLMEFKKYWENKNNLQDSYWTDVLNEGKLISNNLDNAEKRIYLEYYQRLLEGELEATRLKNQKTQAELRSKYGM